MYFTFYDYYVYMSQSLASAKKRRASIQNEMPVPQRSVSQNGFPQTPPNPTGLTIQQVVEILNQRIISLEKKIDANNNSEQKINENKLFMDEIDSRYEMLAEEIIKMKDTLMSLQTYTMNVNKMLLEKLNIVFDESNEKTL